MCTCFVCVCVWKKNLINMLGSVMKETKCKTHYEIIMQSTLFFGAMHRFRLFQRKEKKLICTNKWLYVTRTTMKNKCDLWKRNCVFVKCVHFMGCLWYFSYIRWIRWRIIVVIVIVQLSFIIRKIISNLLVLLLLLRWFFFSLSLYLIWLNNNLCAHFCM